ncbi:MAG: 1-deoxy-D-xylulose-5-phosphate reductoisomerase [Candidatus Cloacimonadaceae bacterium]
MVKKRIALLGASGSIGKSTLQVIQEQSDRYELVLATAHNNYDFLIQTAEQFKVPNLVLTNEQLKTSINDTPAGTKLLFGESELIRFLEDGDYDIALNAISGSAGLRSTLAVLKTGKTLALANKESLVMAGHLVHQMQAQYGSSIIPVDSEHSAVFQAIGTHPNSEILKVHLTASGGAFRDLPLQDFDKITVDQALRHPNWDMGAKVTLDSATMFNKALEVMEARWLFHLDWSQIKAVLHPQSIIHSLVEFVDGSILAQMSTPDMKLPILYALSYPERCKSALVKTKLTDLPALTFGEIEPDRYPLFYLGCEAGKRGGIMPTVVNAANEAALRLFLEKKISFRQITDVVSAAFADADFVAEPDVETIIETNRQIYRQILAD